MEMLPLLNQISNLSLPVMQRGRVLALLAFQLRDPIPQYLIFLPPSLQVDIKVALDGLPGLALLHELALQALNRRNSLLQALLRDTRRSLNRHRTRTRKWLPT